MPYSLSWHIENRVVLIEIIGQIDLEEFQRLHNDAFDYVTQSDFKVHAIGDLSQFEAIPTNIRLLSSATNTAKSPNQGMTILVMPKVPAVIRFVGSIVMQTLRLEYRICDTIEDAMKILQQVDMDIRALTTSE